MLIDVKVPQLSESVAEATLVSWHKQEGQAVARDENLIDIETDKVVLELPAPESGVLVKILKGNGESVVAGEVIAQLDTEAKAAAGAAAAAPGRCPQKLTSAPAAAAPAGPAARKLMAEKGIDAAGVEGSGRGGRVTKADVLEAQRPARRRRAPRRAGAVSRRHGPARRAGERRRHRRRAHRAARADDAACAPASPSAWCSRSRPPPSSPPSTR